MCFTGSPGTGKTTVARIITGLLYTMGYIKENKCIEVNGQNLKGGYTGQTAIITKLVLKSAKNKVLFIDEAYALFDDYNGFGKEAVAVILKQMEDDRDSTVVIFAGYKNDMEQFLKMNDGLKSRINRYIDFANYSVPELVEILMLNLRNKKLYITEEALAKCVLAFKKAEISERFSNGRFVRNLLEKIEYEHAYNTSKIKDTKRQDTIEVQDIPDELINELLTRSM
jgi:AAA+ superfamily predicted ATPase